VDRVAELVPRVKVGHAGTLDPLASGVLVLCLGSATRLVEYVQCMPKTYCAVVRLGARSDTLDADGQIEELTTPSIPSEPETREALTGLVGDVLQLPPQYSALRIRGRRAYDLARSGREAPLEPRRVRIDRIEIKDYEWPRLVLVIDCGAGTYIRSIARDVGEKLGCGGLLESLARTRIGHFTIETAIDTSTLTRETLAAHLRPPREAVADLPALTLYTEEQLRAVAQGRTVSAASLAPQVVPNGQVALLAADGRLLAVAQGDTSAGTLHPFKVML
jgi:tRNA pseudouridine55 synthase